MKKRVDKEMIRSLIELTEYLKSCGINPVLHFIGNESSIYLKMTMNTMNIKYQLVPPDNHRAKQFRERNSNVQTHFIVVLCSVDKEFHLQLWDTLLQRATISLNFLRQSRSLPHLSAYTHNFV